MRILYLNSVCNSGSTGKIAYELYKRSNADGNRAAICYGRGKKISDEENIYKFALDGETLLHAGLTRITGLTGCYSCFSTRRLIKFMDEFKPDIVHLHEPHAYFMNIKPFFDYLKKHKIPLVYTMHCEYAYTGNCGFAFECDKWKTGCGNCEHLKEYPASMFFDFTRKMLKDKKALLSGQNMIVAAPSKWLADRIGQSYLAENDIRVVHNGIDTENVFYPHDFKNLKEGLNLGNKKIVLAVAPYLMDERKGGKLVLALAESMKRENVHFIMIGVDDLSQNFPDNVTPLARTDNQNELAEYYSMADCFLICSKAENLPTTCVEAICCGTPVVGFDVGGTAETAPPPLGLFCDYGDLAALRENLLRMLSNPPEKAAFSQARLHWSAENMYNEYRKIYEDLI